VSRKFLAPGQTRPMSEWRVAAISCGSSSTAPRAPATLRPPARGVRLPALRRPARPAEQPAAAVRAAALAPRHGAQVLREGDQDHAASQRELARAIEREAREYRDRIAALKHLSRVRTATEQRVSQTEPPTSHTSDGLRLGRRWGPGVAQDPPVEEPLRGPLCGTPANTRSRARCRRPSCFPADARSGRIAGRWADSTALPQRAKSGSDLDAQDS
jgi:hypothetical protein